MKKLTTLAILIVLHCLLDACCDVDNFCFTFNTIGGNNISMVTYEAFEEGVDTVQSNAYGIELSTDIRTRTCLLSGSFGSSLYAITCEDPIYVLTDKIRKITIRSNADLNENFPAGSDLNRFFRPVLYDTNCGNFNPGSIDCASDVFEDDPTLSLESAVSTILIQSVESAELYPGIFDYLPILDFDISEDIIPQAYVFTVQFEFESGQSLEAVTEEVILK
ncbi:MAG: hypothetical protein AAF990_00500 [Bacteroidota bacterium]